MNIGDVILTNEVSARDRPVKPTFQAKFKSAKGSSMVFLMLGTTYGNAPFDAEKVLNRLGWTTPKPLTTEAAVRDAEKICDLMTDLIGNDEQHPLYPMLHELMCLVGDWEDANRNPDLAEVEK